MQGLSLVPAVLGQSPDGLLFAPLVAAVSNWTPVGVADTTNMTDNGHQTIQGGSSTQRVELNEVNVSGLASAGAVTPLVLGHTSTVGATLTAGKLAAVDPSSAAYAAPPVSYAASTTKPQRSSTLGYLINCTLNAFGGVIIWKRGADRAISLLGNTASLGELSLNCISAGSPGAVTSTIVIEPL